MRIFIDAEFLEDGPHRPIDLISIALVSESGNELYLINSDFNWPACPSKWLVDNVFPHLNDTPGLFKPYSEMADVISKWIAREVNGALHFWGYYCAYDWVVFCQIFGRMIDLPEQFPKYCMDLKQAGIMLGNPELPKQAESEHNALHDARWNKKVWKFLVERAAEADQNAAGK